MTKDEKNELQAILYNYKFLIHKHITALLTEYKDISLEREDLWNLISIDIGKSMKNFDRKRETGLAPYLNMVIRKSGINHCRKMISQSHRPMNYAIEFQEQRIQFEEEDMTYDKKVEHIRSLCKGHENWFTSKELETLDLILKSYTLKEISIKLNKSIKTIHAYKLSISEKLQKLEKQEA